MPRSEGLGTRRNLRAQMHPPATVPGFTGKGVFAIMGFPGLDGMSPRGGRLVRVLAGGGMARGSSVGGDPGQR